MYKVIDCGGWDYGEPVSQIVKVSSRGLVGSDYTSLVKRAGHAFAESLRHYKCAKDEVPVHIIALGAWEAFGPNRNGDAFKAATCREHHGTFKKYAKAYRNHVNKDPRVSYGIVKDSKFNEQMQRIELLALLNAEKSAAERNNGLIADVEIEKLSRGEDLKTSMACMVPFDSCSFCGNKAKTRADYCTSIKEGGSCPGFGCRNGLTKVSDDGRMQFVDNPSPRWFDISSVFRNADRISYGMSADWMSKAASAHMSGAEMAEIIGITMPPALVATDLNLLSNERIVAQVKLAHALAAYEPSVSSFDRTALSARDRVPTDNLGAPGTQKFAKSLAALADNKIVLSLAEFAEATGRSGYEHAAAKRLKAAFVALDSDQNLVNRLSSHAYRLSALPGPAEKMAAARLAESCSFEFGSLQRRVFLSAIRSEDLREKKASAPDRQVSAEDAEKLATEYGLYQLAALGRIAESDLNFPLTVRLSVGQNIQSSG